MAKLFEVANSVSIYSIIDKYTSIESSRLRRANTCCPICGNGNKTGCFSLYKDSSPEKNRFKCFTCGATGNGIELVRYLKGYENSSKGCAAAAELICKDFNLEYETTTAIVNEDFEHYKEVYKFLAERFHYWYVTDKNPDVNYFFDRGLTREVFEEYLLGYCPKSFTKEGKYISFRDLLKKKFPDYNLDAMGLYNSFGDCIFAGRYIFPIKDSRGNIVAFSGRSLDESEAKYVNSPETTYFKKSFTLYNLYRAKSFSSIYVVEGFMDALSLINCGIINVVASMGTAFSNSHLSLLKEKDIILSLDNDKAGLDNTLKIIESNRSMHFKVLIQYAYKDFNEALIAKEDLNYFIKHRRLLDAPEFLVEHLKNTLDLSLQENRNVLAIRLAKLIGAVNPAKQKVYPVNLIYTDLDLDYYWKRTMRLFKRKRG